MALDMVAAPGILTLPDIAYERKTVRTTINGKLFAAEGWVNGPGCPGRIKAEYARKLKNFASAFLDSNEAQAAAQFEFFHDALCVVLEKPPSEEIDLLAGDEQRASAILVALKWQDPPDADAAEDDADPEAVGGDGTSTTRRSSPTSVRPTARRRTAAAG